MNDTHSRKVVFKVDDIVWEVLTCDGFLVGEYNKLKERKISLLEVLKKINDNTYKLCLSIHLKTFNVQHLKPYLEEHNSRTSSL